MENSLKFQDKRKSQLTFYYRRVKNLGVLSEITVYQYNEIKLEHFSYWVISSALAWIGW